jgi:hypothetical protein
MNVPLLPGRIEHWPLVRLKPYARNAKTHDADQVAKIAASMAEFGWTVPVLVASDGELIAGHGRILAAAHLGLTEAPVIVLGHLTEAQRRAYRIADNKLTELGGWDEALLLQELQALLAEDFDLGLIGIPEDELDALLHVADDRSVISDDAADASRDLAADSWVLPEVPLGEAFETYELELRSTSGALIRTVAGLGSPAFTYSAQMIAQDLTSLTPRFTVRVFQIGRLGRGTAAEIEVRL